MKTIIAGMSAVLLGVAAGVVPAAADPIVGDAVVSSEWRNPSNSVHIRIDKCGGERLCGVITWANAKAMADARRGGTNSLIGTVLFRDLAPAGAGRWRGKVFVPDIRRTFSGTVDFDSSGKMVGKGCVLFGAICKAQTWSRLK